MYRRILGLIFVSLCVCQASTQAQDFKLFDRNVQIHGFASQGFVHTNDNNWLTMNTSGFGSGEFTDFGANASTQITDKFRIGAQLYDRNLGGLGKCIRRWTGPSPATNSLHGLAFAVAR